MKPARIRLFAAACAAVCLSTASAENPGWDYRVRNIYIPKGGYFATGFVPTSSPKVTIRCSIYSDSTAVDVFGTAARQAGCYILDLTGKQFYYRYGNKDHAGAWGSYVLKCPLDLVCDNKLVCYGTTLGTVASPGSMAANTLEVAIPGKGYLGEMDLFSFKAEEGGTTKCEFIPCVKSGVPQLYDTVSGTFITMSGTGTPVAGARIADDGSDFNLRGIVTTLPASDANGWYVFGDPSFSKANDFNSTYIQTMVYPKWSAMSIPAGAKIKLIGGIVMDKGLPSDAQIDMSEVKGMVMIDQGAFGARTITVPSGTYFRASFGAVTETNSVLYQASKVTTVVTNDVVMNGILRQSDSTAGSVYFDGRFSGSGTIESTNFGKHKFFRGPEFSFTGMNNFNSNYGGSIQLTTKSCNADWKKCSIWGSSGDWEKNESYCGSRVVFNPPAGYDQPLLIDELTGGAKLHWVNGAPWRAVGFMCLWGGHTVHAKRLTGPIHFIADSNANLATRDAKTSGYGNVEIDTMTATAYLSTNMNITVGSVSGSVFFDYRGDTNAVNTATLSVTNSCASTVGVKAADVLLLPRTMKGLHASSPVSLVGSIEGRTYPMPLDFAATVVNPAGCDGSGTLSQAPSTGTLAVTFPTGADDPVPAVPCTIPLAVFDHVGTKLDNWSVTINGSSDSRVYFRDCVIKVVRNDTGISLKASKAGLQIFLR